MSAIDKIRAALQAQSQIRIETTSKDDRPKYTTYQGDRKIQQLGDEILDDNKLLSNASIAIGDPVMPLAKGDVIRRVDSINGGANLGTPFRRALEDDALNSGNNRSSEIGRNGGLPSEATSPNFPNGNQGRLPKKYPPPNGCVPVSNSCFWSDQPTPPRGYQGYGDAVINEDGLALYLYCKNVTPPNDLGCEFLKPTTWACSGGVCFPSDTGIYPSLEACQAALIPPPFLGGQCRVLYTGGTARQDFVRQDGTTGSEIIRVDSFFGALLEYSVTVIRPFNGFTTIFLFRVVSDNGASVLETVRELGARSITLTILSLDRADGLPDNCGNLPPSCPT